MSHKQKKSRILASAILILLLLLAGVSIYYINDYYRAEPAVAESLMQAQNGVQVEAGEGDVLLFRPQAEADLSLGLIFYPGGKVEYTAYAPLMKELAERGISCILVKMPANLAILDPDRAEGLQAYFPQISQWMIGGHSLGGTSAAMYLQKTQESYCGLVLLGAYSSKDLSQSGLGVLSIYGSCDGVMNRENYEKYKSNLPAGFEEFVIEGACHAGFGSYGPQKGDGTAKISSAEQQAITADRIAQWAVDRTFPASAAAAAS